MLFTAQVGKTEFYEVGEVAKKLGVEVRTLRKYIQEGFLRGQKVGGRWLVTAEALDDFLNARSGSIAGTRAAKEKPAGKPKTKTRRKK